jgi:hypothetical protein
MNLGTPVQIAASLQALSPRLPGFVAGIAASSGGSASGW